MSDFIETYRAHSIIKDARGKFATNLNNVGWVSHASVERVKLDIDAWYEALGKQRKDPPVTFEGSVVETYRDHQIMIDRDTLHFYATVDGKERASKVIGEIRFAIDKATEVSAGHPMPPPGAKPGVFATLELTRDDIVTFTEAFRRAMNSLDNEATADSNMADDLIIIDAMGNRQRADAYRKCAKDKSDLCEKMRVWLHQLETGK